MVTGHVWYFGDRLSDRTRPVTTPNASGVNQKQQYTEDSRSNAGSVRSGITGRVRSGVDAYCTPPDAAAQRPVICDSMSGVSVRLSAEGAATAKVDLN